MENGFDNARYVELQAERIRERLACFEGKLYLEFAGRMAADGHASRVLPGFDPAAKVRVLQALADQVQVLVCVNARALAEESPLRASLGAGRTADLVVLQAVEGWKALGLDASAVAINRFDGQREARNLRDRLEIQGARVYTQPEIEGFPGDLDRVLGRGGWERFPRITTDRPIVLVFGLGIESGKHTTCLSLLFRDRKAGIRSGYARWATFPVPDLAVTHPVNAAFDAAGADVDDHTRVDPFHLEAAGETRVMSSREIRHYGLVRRVLERIIGPDDPMAGFRSPTELGVNACGEAITDADVITEAAKREIVRRWYRYHERLTSGGLHAETMERMEHILHDQGLSLDDRAVVAPAQRAVDEARQRGKGHKGIVVGAALELPDGRIVTGANSRLMHAASAVLIRATKELAGIDAEVELLSTPLLERVRAMKASAMDEPFASLSLEEALIALSVSSGESEHARQALEALPRLRGCDMHITHIPTPGDASGLRKVGLYYTTDARLTFGERGY
jgi:uncharacterized protein (UPF0371 family)